MRLCPVWPLSVKVESSAEAYGKPQPSSRQSAIDAHSPEEPSETFHQSVLTWTQFKHPASLLYFFTPKEHGNCILCDPFVQQYRSVHSISNSCVVTICSGSWPICSVHSGLGLVKKGRVAN